MNTVDAYKAIQKSQFPGSYSRRKGKKQHTYGCSCCWKFPLPVMKEIARKKAKHKLKDQDRKEFAELC